MFEGKKYEPIINIIERSAVKLSKNDFKSDIMVKWCAGCGAHLILDAVKRIFPEIGYQKDKFVFVSGIGCSSRFPYYVDSYGFHGIHGRAFAIATGIKLANPGLSVWIATGDGDAMAIGGNHFIHIIRRNVDVNIMLFNNQIYGLTKGQYSPTSPIGAITKTSPHGTIEQPFNCGSLVLGSSGTFFARAITNNIPLMADVMYEAAKHDGTSVIEILQNCPVYNENAFSLLFDKSVGQDYQLILEHGKPMIFGKNKDKGLMYVDNKLKVVKLNENGVTINDILIHNMYSGDMALAQLLVEMSPPEYPMVLGVIWAIKKPTYDDLMVEQIEHAKKTSIIKNMDDLWNSDINFY